MSNYYNRNILKISFYFSVGVTYSAQYLNELAAANWEYV